MFQAIANCGRRRALLAVVLAAFTGGFAFESLAEDLPSPSLSRLPGERPNRDYNGMPVGAWTLFPSIFVGGIYDTNVNQTQNNPQASAGGRVVPSVSARWSNGIHTTNIYGMMDARGYTAATDASAITARSSVTHSYRPLPDLGFQFQGDYLREKDFLNASFGLGNVNNPQPPNPFGIMTTANPGIFNQFSGSASMQKDFYRSFLTLTGAAATVSTEKPGLVSTNGNSYIASGRFGIWVTPFVNTFVEAGADWRRYTTTAFDSHGYRAIAGVASDRIGLFQGQLYGGYQAEKRDYVDLNATSAIYGGSLIYLPTRYLTVRASLDQTLGISTAVPIPVSPLGTSTRGTTALLQTTYSLAREWSAATRFGYIRTEYIDTIRHDDGWLAGATWNYWFWRNFAVTVDYQYSQVQSNVPLNSFNRQVVSVGGTYRY
jgi:Putative beta-barrel porin 2